MRKWIANRLLGLATYALPKGHPAVADIYSAAWAIDDPEWPEKVQRRRDAGWFSLVMCAAAEIEDAGNCLRDSEAKKKAEGAAKHYREKANERWRGLWSPDTN